MRRKKMAGIRIIKLNLFSLCFFPGEERGREVRHEERDIKKGKREKESRSWGKEGRPYLTGDIPFSLFLLRYITRSATSRISAFIFMCHSLPKSWG